MRLVTLYQSEQNNVSQPSGGRPPVILLARSAWSKRDRMQWAAYAKSRQGKVLSQDVLVQEVPASCRCMR